MIYTASYFDKKNHHGTLIAISNSMPRDIKVDKQLISVAPDWDKVCKLKESLIDWAEFEFYYRAKLSEAWKKTSLHQYFITFTSTLRDCTLLCWEKDPSECHRSILAEFLRALNYSVKEIN